MDIDPLAPLSLACVGFRFGYVLDYLAVDGPMLEYGEDQLDGLGRLPVYELQYQSSAVRIFKIKR